MQAIVGEILNVLSTPLILVHANWDTVTENSCAFLLYFDARA